MFLTIVIKKPSLTTTTNASLRYSVTPLPSYLVILMVVLVKIRRQAFTNEKAKGYSNFASNHGWGPTISLSPHFKATMNLGRGIKRRRGSTRPELHILKMSHDSYQLPRLEHPWIALCMNIAFLQLDVRAAISLLSGNAFPSTVLQANLPVAVTIMPTPFRKKTIKCFTV